VTAAGLATWLDYGLEASWLIAAVVVPLIVVSEHSFISITELPKVASHRIIAGIAFVLLSARLMLDAYGGRLTERFTGPRRALVCAAFAVLVATALSTVLSISPSLSIWGKEPGNDGYGLYNTGAHIVMFLAVALGLRTRPQAWRLVGAIALAGTLASLIGIAQHWDISPFGISGTAGDRVTGPSGNPIFLGALLVLTLPAALGLAAVYARYRGTPAAWWAATLAVTFIHLFALLLTLSRGPWLGTACALALLAILTWLRLGRGLAVKLASIAAVSAGAAVLALSIPVGAPAEVQEPVGTEVAGEISEPVPAPASSAAVAYQQLGGRLTQSNVSTGISHRWVRWTTSFRLLLHRPELPVGTTHPWAIRTLAGYGPDSLRYAFPLEAPSSLSRVLTTAAHNDPLTRAAELGLLGVLAYGALVMVAVAVLAARLRGERAGDAEAALLIGLGAALLGHFVEQQWEIAQVSDTLMLWLMLGLIAAVPADRAPAETRVEAGTSRTASLSHGFVLAGIAGIAVLAVAAGVLTWSKNVGYLQADNAAAASRATFGSNPERGLEQVERAILLAPDVPDYHNRKASMLRAVADTVSDPFKAFSLRQEAHESDRDAFELNPFSRDANYILAESAWNLAQAGVPDMAMETVEAYERLAALTPQAEVVWVRLGQLYDALGIEESARLTP